MSAPPRIIFFPGLGADHRLLEPQRALNAQIDVPPWIDPSPGESLSQYSARLAETIDTTTPFFLGGISLGGMIAQEVARRTKPVGLILVSTCRNGSELFRWQRVLAPTARFIPLPFIASGKFLMPKLRRLFGVINADQAATFDAMLLATSPKFMRWSIQAVASWPGAGPLETPTLRIHGGRDRIIPLRRSHCHHVIEGAGHVVNMTHAAEVNQLIQAWTEQVTATAMPPAHPSPSDPSQT
jgi:pimeloyl-ACP methyl ester carboxylesterase